jgi:hypothetical protein
MTAGRSLLSPRQADGIFPGRPGTGSGADEPAPARARDDAPAAGEPSAARGRGGPPGGRPRLRRFARIDAV